MGRLEEFLDKNEDLLWQTAFPYCYQQGLLDGVYTAPILEDFVSQLENGKLLTGVENQAAIRLDMAIACLWPHVRQNFALNLFPHRLAAATDLLRAVNFGEGQSPEIAELSQELIQALDHLEKTLQTASAEAELAAAEEEEKK